MRYYSCDYATFRKIKRLRHLLFLSIRRKAEFDRWLRKAPQNRVWRRRPYRGAKPEVLGPRPAPVQSPLTLFMSKENTDRLEENYNRARFPVAGPEGVSAISETWLSLMEVWLIEAEKWFREHGKQAAPSQP